MDTNGQPGSAGPPRGADSPGADESNVLRDHPGRFEPTVIGAAIAERPAEPSSQHLRHTTERSCQPEDGTGETLADHQGVEAL